MNILLKIILILSIILLSASCTTNSEIEQLIKSPCSCNKITKLNIV